MHVASIYVSSISGVSYVCCKCSSRCCICLQWFSRCFQAFLQVFQMLASNVLSVFFCILQLLNLYVSKVHQGVAHGMRVGSGWRRGRRLGRCEPAARALARKPDALGRSFARCAGTVRTLAPRIGHPGASKSDSKSTSFAVYIFHLKSSTINFSWIDRSSLGSLIGYNHKTSSTFRIRRSIIMLQLSFLRSLLGGVQYSVSTEAPISV